MTRGRLKWEPREFSAWVFARGVRACAVVAAIPCPVVLLGLGSLALACCWCGGYILREVAHWLGALTWR